MSLRYATLDVFTETRYRGNPVAIVHQSEAAPLSQEQKQLIAREFNFSETVILHEQTESEKQKGDVRIDIFTVHAEVPFAGHPTVGTSNYLLRYLKSDPQWRDIKALITKAGPIPIALDASGDQISLQVAHNVHIHSNPFAGRPFSHYPVVSIVKGMTFILAGVGTLEDLAKCNGNLVGTSNTYSSQDALDEGWRQGIVTTFYYVDLGVENNVRRIRTRMFGSREDPATGSASSALVSYLSLTEDGERTRQYHLIQGVEMGRRSDIDIKVTLKEGTKEIEEVLLSGTAIKVMEGTLEIPSA